MLLDHLYDPTLQPRGGITCLTNAISPPSIVLTSPAILTECSFESSSTNPWEIARAEGLEGNGFFPIN
jgi:hypothetical protein